MTYSALREALERATPHHPDGVRSDVRGDVEKFYVHGLPCEMPIASFGYLEDAVFFHRSKADLPSLFSDLDKAVEHVTRTAQHPCIRRQAEFGGDADNPNCGACYSCEARAFLTSLGSKP